MKNPRFKDDAVGALRKPDIDKIQCRDCAAREADRMNGAIKGAIIGTCEVYPNKPYGILWKNDKCPYYISDEAMAELDE